MTEFGDTIITIVVFSPGLAHVSFLDIKGASLIPRFGNGLRTAKWSSSIQDTIGSQNPEITILLQNFAVALKGK